MYKISNILTQNKPILIRDITSKVKKDESTKAVKHIPVTIPILRFLHCFGNFSAQNSLTVSTKYFSCSTPIKVKKPNTTKLKKILIGILETAQLTRTIIAPSPVNQRFLPFTFYFLLFFSILKHLYLMKTKTYIHCVF